MSTNATEGMGCPGTTTMTADDIFAFVIDTVVVGTFCLIGIFGNVLTVLVFGSGKQTTISVMLTALAVADGLFLAIHGILFMFLRSIYPFSDKMKDYIDYWPRIEVIEFPFGVTLQACSVFFIVLVAVDRYLALCWGFETRKWNTVRGARIQIVVASICAFVLNVPRFFIQTVVEKFDFCDNKTKAVVVLTPFGNQTGITIHGYIYTSLVYILPVVILFFVNLRLIMTLRRSRVFQRRNSNARDQDNSTSKITAMLCTVIVVFLVCQIPYAINHLLYATKSTMSPVPQRYYNILTNMLVVCNSFANFFVYVIVGKTFRKKLKKILGRKCVRTKNDVPQTSISSVTSVTHL